MKTLFKKDGKFFIRPKPAAELMGIGYKQLNRFSRTNEDLFEKTNDPQDGRKTGYLLEDVINFLEKLGSIDSSEDLPSSIFEDRSLISSKSEVLEELNSSVVLSSEKFQQVFKISTGENIVMENENKEPGIIGDDVVSIRDGVVKIVSSNQDIENDLEKSDTEFQRQKEYVEDSCFGYIDEESDECMKMCRLKGACAEKRNTILMTIAEEAEKMDAQTRKFKNLDAKLEDMKSMRGDIDDWAK